MLFYISQIVSKEVAQFGLIGPSPWSGTVARCVLPSRVAVIPSNQLTDMLSRRLNSPKSSLHMVCKMTFYILMIIIVVMTLKKMKEQQWLQPCPSITVGLAVMVTNHVSDVSRYISHLY